jgi:hypothetical protein
MTLTKTPVKFSPATSRKRVPLVPPILVQRQWSVLDDTLHDEGGAEALDAWEGGEGFPRPPGKAGRWAVMTRRR